MYGFGKAPLLVSGQARKFRLAESGIDVESRTQQSPNRQRLSDADLT